MNMKSYWIWHYGEYEIFHIMNVHLRRETRGYHIPAFWKLCTPYASVKFRKQVNSEGGYLLCRINGSGCVSIDGKLYDSGKRIEIAPGLHTVDICVSNFGGLPAVFIESDICPSDATWSCNHYAGDFSPVGYHPFFDDVAKNPEVFPFEYERRTPINKELLKGGVLYDFGTELFGFLNIENANDGETIGVFYGESREEALDTAYSYLSDSVWGQKSYRLRQRAFRYVYLEGNACDVALSADFEYLPVEAKGTFTCENALFNKIYNAAVHTFHLNCREGFFDGIKRDRWIWSGDAYQSARINRYLFADKDIEQRTLIGLIGKKPIEQHINTIMDYSLLWIIMLNEHYMTYGDKEFLSRIFPMASELLRFVETRLNRDGFVEGFKEDWIFVDWSNMDKCGAVCAEQMLLIEAYRAMSCISIAIGDGDCDELAKKEKELVARVNKYYWNEEKGGFIDSYQSGKNNVTRHANIFAVLYGIANEHQTASILENVLKNDSITKITTPYFEGYELDALAKLGEFAALEEMLKNYWGGMIELGAETIWEEYHPEMDSIEHYAMYGRKYEKSLCHAWGAGPVYLFGRYYLGVYATKPGYEAFEVAPQLGGLSEINGTVPINGGLVKVSLNSKTLSVIATKSGGTLIWKGKRYSLMPNQPIMLVNNDKT